MANTLDVNLITDTLAERAMNTLESKLAPLDLFSTDFSDEPVADNARGGGPRQTLQVELVKTAGDVLTNPTNFEVSNTENAAVSVVMNHLSRPVGLSAQDLNQGRRLMTKATKAAEAIANAVMDSCLSLVTTTNYDNPVVNVPSLDPTLAEADRFSVKHLRALWASLKATPRHGLLATEAYSNLLPGNLEAFRTPGDRTGIFGYDRLDWTDRFAAAGEGVAGFAANPAAMAVAARLPADPGDAKDRDYIISDTVTVESLGISVEYNVWFSRGTREHYLSYDVVFGAAVGDKDALTILLDQSASSS